MVDKKKQGKKNRASGADFERRTRKDLENKGWVVDKFGNNVDINIEGCGELIPVDPSDSNSEGWYCGHYYDALKRKMYCEKCKGILIQAKNKWAGPGRPMMMGAGFPDFIAFKNSNRDKFVWTIDTDNLGHIKKFKKELERLRKSSSLDMIINPTVSVKQLTKTEIIGVECKTNGYLDKTEREKCRWLLDNNVFSKILIASKIKEGRKIVIKYENFDDKYGETTK